MPRRSSKLSMNPRPFRQQTKMSSLRSITTIITTITIANIAGMPPASSWCLADTVITTITTIIITASTAATIEVARHRMMRKQGLRVLFFCA
jgi:Na+/phosphate symporter